MLTHLTSVGEGNSKLSATPRLPPGGLETLDVVDERLEFRVVLHPRGIHHAADAFHFGGHFEPGGDPAGVGVVETGEDLRIARSEKNFRLSAWLLRQLRISVLLGKPSHEP